MDNPWNGIALGDYEKHMSLDSVRQLQAMNELMRDQLQRYPVSSVMIMGVAGGNGLEHVDTSSCTRVYGVDINRAYLAACLRRYPELRDIFIPVEADLLDRRTPLPGAQLVIANLLVEYTGCDAFCRAIEKVSPWYVSCVIQINTGESFVSDSPYLHVFDGLESVHHQMSVHELTRAMDGLGMRPILKDEYPLPNGKMLVRLDFGF